MNSIKHTKCEIVGQLIMWLVSGAILGMIFTIVVHALWGMLTLGGCFVCLFPPIWLFAVVLGPKAAASWIPVGAILGALTGDIVVLYQLRKLGKISRPMVITTASILALATLITLSVLLTSEDYLDRAAIDAQYAEFYESYSRGQYEAAYNLMSPTYRQTHTVEEFKSDFDFLNEPGGEPLEPYHSIKLSGDKAYLFPRNQWNMGLFGSGTEFELEKVEGVWYFTGEHELYLD